MAHPVALSPTTVASFVKRKSCERFIYFSLHPETSPSPRRKILQICLAEKGRIFEAQVEEQIKREGYNKLTQYSTWSDILQLQLKKGNYYAAEVAIEGIIGAYFVRGRMDFVLISKSDNTTDYTILECKASNKPATHHLVQLAMYLVLANLPGQITTKLVTKKGFQPISTIVPPKEMPYIVEDVRHLLAENGRINRADPNRFELDEKCEGCPYDSHCISTSFKDGHLNLLQVNTQPLRKSSIRTVADLAAVDLHSNRELCRTVTADPLFKGSLHNLVQRARLLSRTAAHGLQPPEKLKHAPPTLLPTATDIEKIFLDILYDVASHRIYGIALCHAGDILAVVSEGTFSDTDEEERHVLNRAFELLMQLRSRFSTNRREASLPRPKLQWHYYVWSAFERDRLIEHSRSLNLEHTWPRVFSERGPVGNVCSQLRDEVDRCFAVGLLSRSLSAVTSLPWGAGRFPNGYVGWYSSFAEGYSLKERFCEGIFDFWDENEHTEVRMRFGHCIPPDYFTEKSHSRNDDLKRLVEQRARALQWLEARMMEHRLVGEPIPERGYLGMGPPLEPSPVSACRYMLDYDQRAKARKWFERRSMPPYYRIRSGTCLPLRITKIVKNTVCAQIDLWDDKFPISMEQLQDVCSFTEESFARLCPAETNDPFFTELPSFEQGMGVLITKLDWKTSSIELTFLGINKDDAGSPFSPASPGTYVSHHRIWALLEEDFGDRVAPVVLRRLDEQVPGGKLPEILTKMQPPAAHNSTNNNKKPPPVQLQLPQGTKLDQFQCQAIVEGPNHWIQLLHGPPGTGKTVTTAAATVHRIGQLLAASETKRWRVVILTAVTNTAVDTLLLALDGHVRAMNLKNQISLFRLQANGRVLSDTIVPLEDAVFTPLSKACKPAAANSPRVVVVGGTVYQVLKKLAKELEGKATYTKLHGTRFVTPLLVIDEASQMGTPALIALASLVDPVAGRMIVAGDHRQLLPIVAHDWANELSDTILAHKPHLSAFEFVMQLPEGARQLVRLAKSHRLPSAICRLVSKTYEQMDELYLVGREDPVGAVGEVGFVAENWARAVWLCPRQLFLVVHTENLSHKSNIVEAKLVKRLMRECPAEEAGIEGADVAVLTPHRAQRCLLSDRLHGKFPALIVDTVDRMQGGERRTIIVSATVSDPAAIQSTSEFTLSLNRATVAFSRARNRLVVIASSSFVDSLPCDLTDYTSSVLWKELRILCSRKLADMQIGGAQASVWTHEL